MRKTSVFVFALMLACSGVVRAQTPAAALPTPAPDWISNAYLPFVGSHPVTQGPPGIHGSGPTHLRGTRDETAIDFDMRIGTPLYAVAPGQVIYVGGAPIRDSKYGYGLALVIEHSLPDGSKLYSLYAHLSRVLVNSGDAITNPATQIALSGNTGNTVGSGDGSHLHFAVRADPGLDRNHPLYSGTSYDVTRIRGIAWKDPECRCFIPGADYDAEAQGTALNERAWPAPSHMDPARRDAIAGMYRELLWREPGARGDPDGLDSWDRSGLDLDAIRAAIKGSDEYRRLESIRGFYVSYLARNGEVDEVRSWNLSPLTVDQIREGFVRSGERRDKIAALYRDPQLLDRPPDDAGLQSWVDSGLSLAVIRDRFLASDEYKLKHGPPVTRAAPAPGPAPVAPAAPGSVTIDHAAISVVETVPGRTRIRVDVSVTNRTHETVRAVGAGSGTVLSQSATPHSVERGSWRIGVDFDGDTAVEQQQVIDHRWRWGFAEDIQPGGSGVAYGWIDLTDPGEHDYYVGLVHEGDAWLPWRYVEAGRIPFHVRVAPAATAACTNVATFLGESYPDNSHVAAGASFTKTWTFRNDGSCNWGDGYSAVFTSGTSFGAGTTAVRAAPGSQVDVTLAMNAPAVAGTYRGDWQLRTPSGVPFMPFWVIVVVDAAAAPPSAACSNRATFVGETYPDNTHVVAGSQFTKAWTFRNDGSCTWGDGYSAVFISGTSFGAGTAALRAAPGALATVSLGMTAPSAPGTYRGDWQLRTPAGGSFEPLWVIVIVDAPAPAPAAPGRSEIVVDELSGGFVRGGTASYWRSASLGYGGHMYWTYVNGGTTDDFGEWHASLAGGNYEVQVFIPRDDAYSQAARYLIYTGNTVASATVNQANYFDAWVSLGTYGFVPGDRYVRLNDGTGEAPNTLRKLGFDAVRFIPR